MARLSLVLACSIGAWLLCPPHGAAQRSHYQRQQEQRRLAEQREHIGDRYAAERARAEYCAEVGEAVCRESERRASHELWVMFVRPSLGYLALGGLAIAAFLWWRARVTGRPLWRRRVVRSPYPPVARPAASLDLVVLDVALTPAAAASVRAEIERALARRHALEAALTDAARALLLARGGWTHAAVRSWPVADAADAEKRYLVVVREARARASTEERAHRDSGPGYRGAPADAAAYAPAVLLSLAVLSRDEIPEQGGAPDEAATGALRALAAVAAERVQRVELTWLPDARDEALPAAELVARHPRLIPIVARQ